MQTLGFVARRLMAEPAALLFAVRDAPDVLAGLPDIVIEGLSDTEARELLESVMVGGIDPLVRDRVVAETRGIPLALLEIPRTFTASELAGGFWNMGGRSSPGHLEEGFARASSPCRRRRRRCCWSLPPNRWVTPRCFSVLRRFWALQSTPSHRRKRPA